MTSPSDRGPAVVLYEDFAWRNFLPLAYTRPVFQLLCGMDALAAKVGRAATGAAGDVEFWCRESLAPLLREQQTSAVNARRRGPALFLNGRGLWRGLPEVETVGGRSWIGTAGPDDEFACLYADEQLAAELTPEVFLEQPDLSSKLHGLPVRDVSSQVELLHWPWELVLRNRSQLVADWRSQRIAAEHWGRVDAGAALLAPESIQIGLRSRVKPGAVIDAESGPVWIGEGVTIGPQATISGPAFLGDGCVLHPGTVIQPGTTLGPGTKVGGEISASIVHGYSNKQHYGFLGNSYVGMWVNIAAGCTNCNLKNTYGTVRVPIGGSDVETGEPLVGMLVGDYAKLGVNVAIPAGGVIGCLSCVFIPRPPKFVPSCTWWDADEPAGLEPVAALRTARRMMSRRNQNLSPTLRDTLHHLWHLAPTCESPPAETGRAPVHRIRLWT